MRSTYIIKCQSVNDPQLRFVQQANREATVRKGEGCGGSMCVAGGRSYLDAIRNDRTSAAVQIRNITIQITPAVWSATVEVITSGGGST